MIPTPSIAENRDIKRVTKTLLTNETTSKTVIKCKPNTKKFSLSKLFYLQWLSVIRVTSQKVREHAVAYRGALMSDIVNFGKYVFRVFGVKKFKMFEGIARVF